MSIEVIVKTVAGVAIVALFLRFAAKPHKEILSESKGARWTAFAVYLPCGFVLAYVLSDVVQWLLDLDGWFSWLASFGAIVGLTAGWVGLLMGTQAGRDLGDGVPDKEAQRAALLVPTLLPAGWGSVKAVIEDPTGIGTTITAAIMSGISFFFCFRIIQEAVKNERSKHHIKWLWYAAPVAFLGGLCVIPCVAKIDDFAAGHIPEEYMKWIRLAGAAIGAGMLIGALHDLFKKDRHPTDPKREIRKPDQYVRLFGLVGLPLLYLLWSQSYTWFSDAANSGLDKWTSA